MLQAGVDVCQLQRSDGVLERVGAVDACDVVVDSVACLSIAAVQVGGVAVAHVGERQHEDRFVDVVEHHHVVKQAECQIGQSAIVGRSGRKVFDVADSVVAGVADCTADEGREFVEMGDADLLHLFAECFERIGDLRLFDRPRISRATVVVAATNCDAASVSLD